MTQMTPNFTVHGVPAVQGTVTGKADLRYRVWTSEHQVPWSLRPVEGETDGWFAVQADPSWRYVVTQTYDGGRWMLYVTSTDEGERHPLLDGLSFDTEDDALRAAYECGFLGFMVFDTAAERGGLLGAAIAYEDAEQAAGRLVTADRKTLGGIGWAYVPPIGVVDVDYSDQYNPGSSLSYDEQMVLLPLVRSLPEHMWERFN